MQQLLNESHNFTVDSLYPDASCQVRTGWTTQDKGARRGTARDAETLGRADGGRDGALMARHAQSGRDRAGAAMLEVPRGRDRARCREVPGVRMRGAGGQAVR